MGGKNNPPPSVISIVHQHPLKNDAYLLSEVWVIIHNDHLYHIRPRSSLGNSLKQLVGQMFRAMPARFHLSSQEKTKSGSNVEKGS
jgi:hypothetical protein